ncbi:predicted protein [Thalassiosira pseudonana CCMP1335]|uniref:Uncharacterized protein n=1 Tax=Thalassiosira pseudonana TaxID=35128 RepID=B5YLU9_THAPS|nr:predicted protein [Thalassiosira pseudonana CCMP1335]ACI64298.1 predicted protein [Thalassiosira pseudonana CCMP1335]
MSNNPYQLREGSILASSSSPASPPTIPGDLTRKCLQLHHPYQKIASDAVDLSSELLKLLVVEARRRAAIEAECDAAVSDTGNKSESDGSQSWMKDSYEDENDTLTTKKKKVVEIRADHISKIAAELLMDLS